MPDSRRIAVIGADEPVGEAFVQAMQASGALDASRLVPISLDEDGDGTLRLQGEEWPCEAPAGVDWEKVDVAVLAAWGKAAEDLAAEALGRGCQVVASAGRLSADEAVGSRLHVSDDAATAAILRACRPIDALAGLDSLGGFVGLPVSLRGRGGIEELAEQTRSIFAMGESEPELFPVQIAFNLIPQVGTVGAEERSAQEEGMCQALRRALCGQVAVQFTTAWLPTFYGGVAVVQGRCRRALDSEALRERMRHIEGLVLMDSRLPGGVPTPALDALDSEQVFVGRLQVDREDTTRFSLWLTFDGPRLEAAQLLAIQENIN